MFQLARRTLRYRWGGYVATFIGMFFCSMMLVAAGGMMETGLRQTVLPQRLAGADVVVAGDPRYILADNPVGALNERVQVDRDLVTKLAALPGVKAAIPDVAFDTFVLRDGSPVDTEAHGRDWGSAVLSPYSIGAGAAPQRAGEVALDTDTARRIGVSAGDKIKIGAHGAVGEFTVTGIVAPAQPTTERSIFFTGPDVQRLARDPARVDTISLVAQPGTDAAALSAKATAAVGGPGIAVLTGNDRGNAEFPASLEVHDLILIAGIFVALSLVAGLLAVASTLSLVASNREREIAVLRAIGATPWQTRRMILAEALVVSLLATTLSVLPGWFVGEFLYRMVVRIGVAPEELSYERGWVLPVIAYVLAVATSLGAGLITGKRALRARPTAAMAGTDTAVKRTGWVRRIIGLVLFAYSGGLVFVALNLVTGPFIAGPANWAAILFALGVMLLGRDITRVLVAVLTPPLRRMSSVSGYLAALNARARVPQLAAVITPIMLMTSVATATTYVITTEAASINIYTESLAGNVIIKAPPGGFGPEALPKIREVAGVAAASEFTASAGFVDDPPDPRAGADLGGWQFKGFTADAAEKVGAATMTAGSLTELKGDTVVINDVYSKELKRGVGDTITLRLGDNSRVNVKIVGLMSEKVSFESIILPIDLLSKHTTTGLPLYILAAPQPGTSVAQLSAALSGVVAAFPGAQIVDRYTLRGSFEHHLGAEELVNYLFLALLMGFIAISVINTLFLATGHRRREFGLQRLIGATRRQVLRMTAVEGALTALIGIGLGAVIAPLAFVTFALGRTGKFVPAGSPLIFLLIAGAAAVLTLGGTLVAVLRTLRNRPLEAALPT